MDPLLGAGGDPLVGRVSRAKLGAAGRRMQPFHLIFTKGGNRTLAHLCMYRLSRFLLLHGAVGQSILAKVGQIDLHSTRTDGIAKSYRAPLKDRVQVRVPCSRAVKFIVSLSSSSRKGGKL